MPPARHLRRDRITVSTIRATITRADMNRHSSGKYRLSLLLAAALALVAASASAQEPAPAPATGPQLFRYYCASCHGREAEGNGPVAPFFKLQPPDLTEISRRSGGTFPAEHIRRIIDGRDMIAPHGAREMPVWGFVFAMETEDAAAGRAKADATVARLVEYLRSIQKPRRRQ
jgi:mono/diheme cytochrome c family protein